MPIDFQTLFKAFKENIPATIMTLCVFGMVGLFTIVQKDNLAVKNDLKKANKDCATEKYIVQSQMERLNEKYIETFGLLKEVQSEIKILKKLGKTIE